MFDVNRIRAFALILAATAAAAGSDESPATADPGLAAEIDQIRAIDDHAHPVAVTPGDTGYDALPVESMEPSMDPVRLREQDNPELAEAWRRLYGAPPNSPKELSDRKERVRREHGDQYPAWVLDQWGVETMLANRVTPDRGVEAPRFLWVPYADALLFPLDNAGLAAQTPDRRAFFELEDKLRLRYLKEAGYASAPSTLDEYLRRVVTPTLERHRKGGAVAEKFEAAYLRSLDFGNPARSEAERVYSAFAGKVRPETAAYKTLQDFLFRYVAAECGRLHMAVHLHVMAGAGGYFHVGGTDPLLLEPVLNDAALRKTNFVLVHGGWPFIHQVTPLLEKPNAYADISAQALLLYPAALARVLREWLEWVPEKVMFGTDAYPYTAGMGWEESGWIATRNARRALALALTGMLRDGEITRARASELARMVLRDNARKLYGL